MALIGRVDARDPTPGIGVFDHPKPIPNKPACIEFVPNDAATALAISIDGRRVPGFTTARWRDTITVEVVGYVPGCAAGEPFREDAAYYLRLRLDDGKASARLAKCGFVAIRTAASVPSVADDGRHTATDLLGPVFAVQLTDQAAQSDSDRVGDAFVHGADFDSPERGQPFVDAGKVLHIARQAVECLDDHDFKSAGRRPLKQRKNAVAIHYGCTGDSAVRKDLDHVAAFTARVVAAERYLIIDAAIILPVG